MNQIFKRLTRVLQLEVTQGHQNKAVVGGIRQFATFWVGQARDAAQDEMDKVLVEQVAEALVDYGNLPGKEARAKAIDSLLASLKRREERVGATPARPRKRRETRTKPANTKPVKEKPRHEREAHKNAPPLPEKSSPRKTELPNLEPDPEGLQQSTTALKGVGAKVSQLLENVGATTIEALLYTFPRRYDDYTLMKPIHKVQYGEVVTIIGTIWETRARRLRGKQHLVETTINDGTASIRATWFNQPWLAEKLPTGMQVVISGKVEQYLGRPVFNAPEWEPLEMEPLKTRRIVPIYPLTNGLNSGKMRQVMQTAVDQWSPRVPEILPQAIRQKHELLSLPEAIYHNHFPDSQEMLHKARRRVAFDELFLLQIGMKGQRHAWQQNQATPLETHDGELIRFYNTLPYELTGAQKRVIDEIRADMKTRTPMNRLLQGDVGAGKTIVAAAAMLTAVRASAQAALMAPTEILAEQHFTGLSKLLEPLDIKVSLLTGSTPTIAREPILAGLADGSIHIVIGTHALIQETVQFHQLGLAVVDEQHRFGVDQRQALRDKGAGDTHPHLLAMSATPIPRTLALSMYGDLDLSIIDEMPPGRQEIKTRWLRTSERERAYAFIRGQIEQGRQAYVICPLVEESDKIEAKSAITEHERLQTQIFPDLKLGLVHGRLSSREKEEVMRQFYTGELDMLVATSVIEVGVDVPNATVMHIEGANRFGLAQLHQFRGRVGRGAHQSYCLLVADSTSPEAEERLQALEQTNDGFQLAEKDLEIRGPGEFFGRRQSGLPELQMLALTDMSLLEIASQEATALIAEDPELSKPEHKFLHDKVVRFWQTASDAS